MPCLEDYLLAVRVTGAPPAPPGLETVSLSWRPGTDRRGQPVDAVRDAVAALDAVADSGLTTADSYTRIVFLAPPGPTGLVPYAALHGFLNRWIDVHADGAVLEMPGAGGPAGEFVAPRRPEPHLMWAQLGGPRRTDLPWVFYPEDCDGELDPQAMGVVHRAARLRMVPPGSATAAFAMLAEVARLRRRGDALRFPYVSTGLEPLPVSKTDPHQGIDLEAIRRAAAEYRRMLRNALPRAEPVPAQPVGPLNQRITEANTVDAREVLPRLGSRPGDGSGWSCPRAPLGHSEDWTLRLHPDNRLRCHYCEAEKITLVRLVAETLDLTPDQAAAFLLDPPGAAAPPRGTAVVAHIVGRGPAGYRCLIPNPTGPRQSAGVLPFAEVGRIRNWAGGRPPTVGDTVVALVVGSVPGPGGGATARLSLTDGELVERVLAGFVPSLASGQVVVQGVARCAGAQTKVAVAPADLGIDARGTCVGKGGANRPRRAARFLTRGLTSERIEIINYASDPATYLANALAPAKVEVSDVRIEGRQARVTVPRSQCNTAIGRGGLNAQLAGQLTGLRVYVVEAGTTPATPTRGPDGAPPPAGRAPGQR